MSFSEKKLKEEIAKRALGTPTDEFVFTVGARWGYSVGYADCAGFNRQAGRNEALNEVKARDAKLREKIKSVQSKLEKITGMVFDDNEGEEEKNFSCEDKILISANKELGEALLLVEEVRTK